MQFDQARLMELAGVQTEEDQGVLSEGKNATSGRRAVNEAADQGTLLETKLRQAIRSEIASILEDFNESEKNGSGSAWMHRTIGQPQNSRTGRVTRGFLGLGFK